MQGQALSRIAEYRVCAGKSISGAVKSSSCSRSELLFSRRHGLQLTLSYKSLDHSKRFLLKSGFGM